MQLNSQVMLRTVTEAFNAIHSVAQKAGFESHWYLDSTFDQTNDMAEG